MDRPTLCESIRYRCHERGETYLEFALEYCAEADLAAALASPDRRERQAAAGLVEMRSAQRRIEDAVGDGA